MRSRAYKRKCDDRVGRALASRARRLEARVKPSRNRKVLDHKDEVTYDGSNAIGAGHEAARGGSCAQDAPRK